uniref:Translation initiation factor IF-2-like n=1 Tax=Macrostomum lignano TaxID=282301 RepID=A0A1I8F5Y9_9PLAT
PSGMRAPAHTWSAADFGTPRRPSVWASPTGCTGRDGAAASTSSALRFSGPAPRSARPAAVAPSRCARRAGGSTCTRRPGAAGAAETGPASIRRFRYAEPLEMERGCATRLWSSPAAGCPPATRPGLLRESLNKQGRRTGGQVLCTCPPDRTLLSGVHRPGCSDSPSGSDARNQQQFHGRGSRGG